MAKDKEDITPIARDFVKEVLAGRCVLVKGNGKDVPDVNECDMRYASAQREVLVALQAKYGSAAVKAFRDTKMSVGEIA